MLLRVFVAVDVTEEVRARVLRIQRELALTGAYLKLVEPENLHFTLRFMGEIPRQSVDAAIRELGKLSARRFRIRIAGMGVFPDLSRPRVVWLGVAEGREAMAELARAVEELVGRYAAHREDREFTPHLTLARVKGPGNLDKLVEFVRRMANVEVGEMEVSEVKLKQSTLTPRGPIYRDLYVVRLA